MGDLGIAWGTAVVQGGQMVEVRDVDLLVILEKNLQQQNLENLTMLVGEEELHNKLFLRARSHWVRIGRF